MAHKITIIFGQDAAMGFENGRLRTRSEINDYGHIGDYEFPTEAELNAFIQGVEEAIGYLDCAFTEQELE